MLSCSCAWIKSRYLTIGKLEGACWIKQYHGEKKKICHRHPVTNVCNCAPSWQNSEIASCLQTCVEAMSPEITDGKASTARLSVRVRTCAPLFAVGSSWHIRSSPRSRCRTPGCRRWRCGHLCSVNPATPKKKKKKCLQAKKNINVQPDRSVRFRVSLS